MLCIHRARSKCVHATSSSPSLPPSLSLPSLLPSFSCPPPPPPPPLLSLPPSLFLPSLPPSLPFPVPPFSSFEPLCVFQLTASEEDVWRGVLSWGQAKAGVDTTVKQWRDTDRSKMKQVLNVSIHIYTPPCFVLHTYSGSIT